MEEQKQATSGNMNLVGIYCYRDKKNSKIVYVGKDSNIEKNYRHKQHMAPYNYNTQQINRVLQNNPDRYKYKVLKKGEFNQNLLNALEILYIKRYEPLFNFTKGGEGKLGFRPTEKTKRKISESLKGNKLSLESKLKSSKTQGNKTGYFRVSKNKCPTCKKGFSYVYSYYDENNSRKWIYCTSIDGLKKKVLNKGLEWQEI